MALFGMILAFAFGVMVGMITMCVLECVWERKNENDSNRK